MSVLSDFGGSDGPRRPDECECLESFEDLACFPCVLAGFEEPNPSPPEADDDE